MGIAAGTRVGQAILDEVVAEGGMGTVYRAHVAATFFTGSLGPYRDVFPAAQNASGPDVATAPLSSGDTVAVKVLRAALVSVDGAVQRFEREARTLLSLRHPNIVTCHELGRLDDGRPFLVMEWLPGRTLADVLHDEGALSLERARPLVYQLCAGLAAAHRAGVVHRDVKPSNIVVSEDTQTVKLVDFGVVKPPAGETQRLTATGFTVGTPSYMAPEQILGRAVTPATDIYALGVVLYRALVGRHPFPATSVSEMEEMHLYHEPAPPGAIAPALACLDDLLLRCLAKDPLRRPASALEVAADLRDAAAGPPARPRPRPRLATDTVPGLGLHVALSDGDTEERRDELRTTLEAEGLQLAVDEPDGMLAVTPLPRARAEARALRARLRELASELARRTLVAVHEAPVNVLVVDDIMQVVGGELLVLARATGT